VSLGQPGPRSSIGGTLFISRLSCRLFARILLQLSSLGFFPRLLLDCLCLSLPRPFEHCASGELKSFFFAKLTWRTVRNVPSIRDYVKDIQ
jgi:hypothetical protein